MTFRSALVPSPYVRKTRSLEAARPWLYLKGISTGEMASALEVRVGLGRERAIRQYDSQAETAMDGGLPVGNHDMMANLARL